MNQRSQVSGEQLRRNDVADRFMCHCQVGGPFGLREADLRIVVFGNR